MSLKPTIFPSRKAEAIRNPAHGKKSTERLSHSLQLAELHLPLGEAASQQATRPGARWFTVVEQHLAIDERGLEPRSGLAQPSMPLPPWPPVANSP